MATGLSYDYRRVKCSLPRSKVYVDSEPGCDVLIKGAEALSPEEAMWLALVLPNAAEHSMRDEA